MRPRIAGRCHGVTEGANAASVQFAPAGPSGYLPRIAGEDL